MGAGYHSQLKKKLNITAGIPEHKLILLLFPYNKKDCKLLLPAAALLIVLHRINKKNNITGSDIISALNKIKPHIPH